jgi:hypothetical protein
LVNDQSQYARESQLARSCWPCSPPTRPPPSPPFSRHHPNHRHHLSPLSRPQHLLEALNTAWKGDAKEKDRRFFLFWE